MHPILRTLTCTCLALVLAGCEGTVQLFANMSERDANEVLASLKEVGIDARKLPGKEGVNLEVDQPSVARAIAYLNAEGLPRERRSNMGDVFRKEGLISSPLEERARYLWALSQELSETISQIDGIVRARVHVVLPERSAGSDPAMPSSAAVFVKYRRGFNLDDATPQIRRLVASSIPGLQADKVTVVLVATGPRAVNGNAIGSGNGAPQRAAAPAASSGSGIKAAAVNGSHGIFSNWWFSLAGAGALAASVLAAAAVLARRGRRAGSTPAEEAPTESPGADPK
ncbi:Nodulation protein NolT precursor [Variovorax sp. PBL-H6]|uniref:type III secretion system inner membrane ring lipoprotein SctJ n=1 Tax=Variovorax sp. PBL-H6 TaxID=434009 RepID=UPI0013164CBE|nr:type III secretion inner membrane ring lipoprotein SctJ [Variovorax sp. PBL-H6]VTU22722.1 Nodulation protein NolT precursor [Variovorax sp. PBL-H6]